MAGAGAGALVRGYGNMVTHRIRRWGCLCWWETEDRGLSTVKNLPVRQCYILRTHSNALSTVCHQDRLL
jgi:hypothetical protein